ncbi:MAG: SDR family oxidoreductase [bacterium]
MKKRLIVTGANGFVGGSVVWHAGDAWEVHAVARKEVGFHRAGLVWHLLDLRDTDGLYRLFQTVKPDVVIHAAAVADIDYCETHRDTAEAVNVGVTDEIAEYCSESGARLIFLSTDTVFDGKKGNYCEEDTPSAVNFYAETKIRAEKIVSNKVRDAVIARLSLVMGLPVLGTGNSFLSRMLASLKDGREYGVPDNEIRTPVDVITLGRALLELAENDFTGFIHLAGNDRLNRFVMSQRIAERLGYSRDLIVVKNFNGIAGRAPRPLDASMDNSKARAALKTPMCGLDDGLELILAVKEGVSS